MISATEQTAATALQDDISDMKNRTIMVIRNQSRSETLESESDLLTVIDSHARAVGYYEDNLNEMKHRSACYQETKKIRNEGEDKGCNAAVNTTSANGNRAFNTGCKVLEVANKSARQAVREATSYYVGSSKGRDKQRVREEVKGKSLTGTKVRSVENAEVLRKLQHKEVVTTVKNTARAEWIECRRLKRGQGILNSIQLHICQIPTISTITICQGIKKCISSWVGFTGGLSPSSSKCTQSSDLLTIALRTKFKVLDSTFTKASYSNQQGNRSRRQRGAESKRSDNVSKVGFRPNHNLSKALSENGTARDEQEFATNDSRGVQNACNIMISVLRILLFMAYMKFKEAAGNDKYIKDDEEERLLMQTSRDNREFEGLSRGVRKLPDYNNHHVHQGHDEEGESGESDNNNDESNASEGVIMERMENRINDKYHSFLKQVTEGRVEFKNLFEALRRNILGWQHLKPDYAFRGSVMGYDLNTG